MMKHLFSTIGLIAFGALLSFSQHNDNILYYENSAERLLQTDGNFTLGGYGEVHFNQPINNNKYQNGTLDVHRFVLLVGYNFTRTTQFISEIEFEHTSELAIEQMFIQQKLTNNISLRAGLLLIPVGIINLYHEPTTFNGVERPMLDNKIIPTTWRDIGLGVYGKINSYALKYEAYIVNGPLSYDGTNGLFKGSNGFRSGRQQGQNATMNSINFTGRIEYFGIRSISLGISTYLGESQSVLYNNINKNDQVAKNIADSSVVNISLIESDLRFKRSGLEARAQIAYTIFGNTIKYNQFTGNDLAKNMLGYYAEFGYNVFSLVKNINQELIPFIRYQKVDTHYRVDRSITKNNNYNLSIITIGLTYRIVKDAVFKIDCDFIKNKAVDNTTYVFNAGMGVMF